MKIKQFPISNRLPIDCGIIHFIGIGGIGMSGIAEILHNLGYKISGSDIAQSHNVKRLQDLGIKIAIDHKPENLADVSVVVTSSAIKKDNVELQCARREKIPVVKRSEMLAELMKLKTSVAIAGTHGKTTITSIVGEIFDAVGKYPTVINGGIINSYGTNAKLGKGDWIIVESDESDGSFAHLNPTIAVVTNMDPEHLDYYGNFDNAKEAYRIFIENLPFYGFAVLCIDHPEVKKMIPEITDRRIVTYGFSDDADVHADNISDVKNGQKYDVKIKHGKEIIEIKDIFLPMYGRHNALNSLAAIAIATELDFPLDEVVKSLASFGGVRRRFSLVGEVGGFSIIDDYAHHPVEIKATLAAARAAANNSSGRVIAVFQPHRYSRLRDLFDDFVESLQMADCVLVSEVYSAGEKPIAGITEKELCIALRKATKSKHIEVVGEQDIAEKLLEIADIGDYVICMGAGSISQWASQLPRKINELMERKKTA